MGSELVGDTSQPIDGSSKDTTPFIKYTDIFEKYCPFYMSIGMSYQEYWDGDCSLTKVYLQSYKLKQERETQNKNYELWLQGLYIYEAILDVSPILHAFIDKNTKPLPYRSKPYPLTTEEMREYEEEMRQERLLKLKEQLSKNAK